MKTLTFIRHGQSEANVKRLVSGQTQTPLTEYGIKELKELKESINYPEADLLFSSDLLRAVDTAKILYDGREPHQLLEFREINFGPYDDQPVLEVMEEFYNSFLLNDKRGQMETYDILKVRAENAVRKVISLLNEHQKNRATIVAHNGFLRMIHHIYKPTSFEEYMDFYTGNGHGYSMVFDAYDKLIEIEYF
ncbi:MAG TPA: histidine phosphatase family protein [Erysipelothrix sp.]|nr:histidine phosphatase family protein [Erysipelothrix sp.]